MGRFIRYLKSKSILSFLYIISIIMALSLCVLVGVDNNYTRKNYRNYSGYKKIDLKLEISEEKTAPMGIVKNYTKRIDGADVGKQLCFYMVHQYVRVFIGDELVYELYPTSSGVGKTLGCDWAFVKMVRNDIGKELRVEVTPVYKIAVENEIDFYLGDGFSVFMNIFRSDLPTIVLCMLTIIISVILFITSAVNTSKLHSLDKRPLLIGIFGIIMSVWKALDTKIAPLIIFGEPKMVYYLSVTLSFVGGATLALYLDDVLGTYKKLHKVTRVISYIFVIFSFAMLSLQFLNISDLRENLSLMHLSLLLFAVVSGVLIYKTKKIDGKFNHDALEILLIMTIGFVIDLVIFQVTRKSDYLYFSFMAFFIYAIIVGIKSISKTSEGIYYDLATGLYNKSYCTKIMDETIVSKGSNAAIMLDLNDLKKTNDVYGHEEGDRLIMDFVTCLKTFNGANNIVGRFGGDEFIFLMRKTSEDYVKYCLATLEYKVAEVNKLRKGPKISYAKGYAIAKSNAESMHEILDRADKLMYENKQEMKRLTNDVVR